MLEVLNSVFEMSRLQDRAPPKITCSASNMIQKASLPFHKMKIPTKKNTIPSKMPLQIKVFQDSQRQPDQLRKDGLAPNKLVE